MNLPGYPMGQNGSMGLSNMPSDPLQVNPNDFQFGIKQEIFENETSELSDREKMLALQLQRKTEEKERENNPVQTEQTE